MPRGKRKSTGAGQNSMATAKKPAANKRGRRTPRQNTDKETADKSDREPMTIQDSIQGDGASRNEEEACPNASPIEAELNANEKGTDHIELPVQITSTSFTLGHVSDKIREKIMKGLYVDLATLLVNSKTADLDEKVMVLNSKDELVTKAKTTKSITSIKMWTDAFLIYISIYTSLHQDKFQEMLKYMHDVRIGSDRSGNWKAYDEQFRLKLVSDPTKSWGEIDPELWLLYMGGQSSLTPSTKPILGKCYSFNYQGYCTNTSCQYTHSCLKCSSNHPAKLCTVQTQTSQPRYNAPSSNMPFRQHNFRPRQLLAPRPRGNFTRYMGPRGFSHQY